MRRRVGSAPLAPLEDIIKSGPKSSTRSSHLSKDSNSKHWNQQSHQESTMLWNAQGLGFQEEQQTDDEEGEDQPRHAN